jgi:hypothetical protein
MEYKLSKKGKFLIINEDGVDTAIAIDHITVITPKIVDVSRCFEPAQIKKILEINYGSRSYSIEVDLSEKQKELFNQLLELTDCGKQRDIK